MKQAIFIDKDSQTPLKEQICQYFIKSIEQGLLDNETLLPPSRELAQQLGVSRDTVVRAYDELKRLAYIESHSTRHFKVSSQIQKRKERDNLDKKQQPQILSRYGKMFQKEVDSSPLISEFAQLNYGGPPLAQLPIKRWQSAVKHFASQTKSINHHPEVTGRIELRSALSAYLNRTKQIQSYRDDLVVFTSTIAATNLFCRLLLNPGDHIAIEEPGFGGIKNIASVQNLKVVPIPVDDQGIVVEKLAKRKEKIKLVYITPSHQEPTGAVLSLARRHELLAWAKQNKVWIIEDDFDGYFDYTRKRIPALKAMEESNNVIYLSTFWRILYPLTCLGFCIVPPQLLPVVLLSKIEVEGVSETITQLCLAKLIDDGYLEKYSRKLRSLYLGRRNQLVNALRNQFENQIQIMGGHSGTKLTVNLSSFNDRQIIQAADHANLPFISMNSYYQKSRDTGLFLIDFSILEEEEIKTNCAKFANHLLS